MECSGTEGHFCSSQHPCQNYSVWDYRCAIRWVAHALWPWLHWNEGIWSGIGFIPFLLLLFNQRLKPSLPLSLSLLLPLFLSLLKFLWFLRPGHWLQWRRLIHCSKPRPCCRLHHQNFELSFIHFHASVREHWWMKGQCRARIEQIRLEFCKLCPCLQSSSLRPSYTDSWRA